MADMVKVLEEWGGGAVKGTAGTFMTRFALAVLLAVSVGGAVRAEDENGPLAKAAQIVDQNPTSKLTLNGVLSTALGLTEGNQRFPVKQKIIDIPETPDRPQQSFNVSHERGRTDIVIFYSNADEGTLYLTSVGGILEKAIHVKKGSPVQEIPLSVAKADFENEKAWWLARLGTP
jgi:hypothetical protein